MPNKKILKSIFAIFAMLALTIGSTGAYFADRETVSGNQLSTGTWPTTTTASSTTTTTTTAPTSGNIVINEILYDPNGTDTGQEWIELYNAGGSAQNLNGYDLFADGSYYTFGSFSLGAGSFVVVHINASGTDTATDLYQGASSNMGNTSGSIALFNSTTRDSSTILDFVEYGVGGQTWQTTAISAGIWTDSNFVPDVAEESSIERSPKGNDTNNPSDFIDQGSPTPGSGI